MVEHEDGPCMSRRDFLRWVAGAAALGAAGALAHLCEAAGKTPPAGAPAGAGSGHDLVHIELGDRFRATAACLLLTPYRNLGLDNSLPHPLRAQTFAVVERFRDHPCARLFQQHVAADNFGGQFYSLSAWLTPSAPFRWTGRRTEMEASNLPPPVKKYLADDQYPKLLSAFLPDTGLPGFWRSTRPEWERVGRQCAESLARYDVSAWLASFWGPSPKRLVMVPNPTDPPTFGFGPTNAHEAFSIIGPPNVPKDTPEASRAALFDYGRDQDLADTAVHEFGHTCLGVARDRILALAQATEDLGRSLEFQGYFKDYGDWPMELEETILRATQGVWQAEKISRASADASVAWQVRAYNLTILPGIYQLLLERRRDGRTLGAAAVVQTAAAALADFRKT
jgi:hypothetical protein